MSIQLRFSVGYHYALLQGVQLQSFQRKLGVPEGVQ